MPRAGLLVALSLLTLTAARAPAAPRPTTLARRVWHTVAYHWHARRSPDSNEIGRELFDKLVPDATTRTGLAAPSERDRLVKALRKGKRLPDRLARLLTQADAEDRDPVELVAGMPARVPEVVREQLAHSIAQLHATVAAYAARGDRELARLIAVEQSHAFARALDRASYEDDVPARTGYGVDRFEAIGPDRGSARSRDRAVVVRSRQPARLNLDELATEAARVGIRPEQIAILDLRFESDRDARWVRRAKGRLRGAIHVEKIALIDHSVPTFEQVDRMVALLTDPAYKMVLIHCKGGVGRTGVMVAAMRVLVDGWSVDRAIAEARDHDMFRPLQEHFIREVEKRRDAAG